MENKKVDAPKEGKYMCSECDTLYDSLVKGCPKCNKSPAPYKPEGLEERKFTLEEVIQIWDAAHLRGFQFEQFSGKPQSEYPTAFNKEDYFKEKFNIYLYPPK